MSSGCVIFICTTLILTTTAEHTACLPHATHIAHTVARVQQCRRLFTYRSIHIKTHVKYWICHCTLQYSSMFVHNTHLAPAAHCVLWIVRTFTSGCMCLCMYVCVCVRPHPSVEYSSRIYWWRLGRRKWNKPLEPNGWIKCAEWTMLMLNQLQLRVFWLWASPKCFCDVTLTRILSPSAYSFGLMDCCMCAFHVWISQELRLVANFFFKFLSSIRQAFISVLEQMHDAVMNRSGD